MDNCGPTGFQKWQYSQFTQVFHEGFVFKEPRFLAIRTEHDTTHSGLYTRIFLIYWRKPRTWFVFFLTKPGFYWKKWKNELNPNWMVESWIWICSGRTKHVPKIFYFLDCFFCCTSRMTRLARHLFTITREISFTFLVMAREARNKVNQIRIQIFVFHKWN